jgi:undecaprenyl diphosphate synthase
MEGHRHGAEVFKDIAIHAFECGVSYLSAYVFSQENWQRTEEEVGYLMNLVASAVERYLDEFHERGIKIVILGRRDGIRRRVLNAIARSEERTKDNTGGTLALCFNYGGKQEIVDAANRIIENGRELSVETMDAAVYEPSIPPLDLIIRTSGEQRLSGFMLWRSPYAELYFTPTLWPAFSPDDFDAALADYEQRQRRFGH